MVRSRISPLSARTEPPGRSSDERRTADATSSNVNPWRRRAISETSIEISYGRALVISTWEMPGIAESSSRTSSATAFRVDSSALPDTATSTTWLRPMSSRTIGFSVSTGNVSMASTRPLMSSMTLRASAPSSSSTMTMPIPSEAVEVISPIPSRPWIASSMRMETATSTSSGAAPRYGTSMLIMSSENSGNTSELTVVIEIAPLIMMKNISRLAATGFFANHAIIRFTT